MLCHGRFHRALQPSPGTNGKRHQIHESPGKVHIRVFGENEKIVFSVADTGIGIASAEQKNIFNDFYRVGDEMTRSTKGSGLGLAIVKRVAEAHKANVSVQSHPGKGSTFTVKFKKAE